MSGNQKYMTDEIAKAMHYFNNFHGYEMTGTDEECVDLLKVMNKRVLETKSKKKL
jgi:hypothetical protein